MKIVIIPYYAKLRFLINLKHLFLENPHKYNLKTSIKNTFAGQKHVREKDVPRSLSSHEKAIT